MKRKVRGEVTVGIIAVLASVTISAIGGVTLLFGRSYAKAEEATKIANDTRSDVLLLKKDMDYMKSGIQYLIETNETKVTEDKSIKSRYPALFKNVQVASTTKVYE